MPSIPPPPPTKPEGVGIAITAPTDEEPGGPEDYYKRIHASRTVLAMKAVKPPVPGAMLVEESGASKDAQVLLARVFAAEKEARDERERREEAERERDVARGEALVLRATLDAVRAALLRSP